MFYCDILHMKSLAITYTAGNEANKEVPSNITDPVVTITIPRATLTNGQVFTLDIVQSLPSNIPPEENPMVNITDGLSTYDLYLGMGNYVRTSNIKSRKRLVLVYGNDPYHISVIAPCLRA